MGTHPRDIWQLNVEEEPHCTVGFGFFLLIQNHRVYTVCSSRLRGMGGESWARRWPPFPCVVRVPWAACFTSPWSQHTDLCSSSDHTGDVLILPFQLQSLYALVLQRKLSLTDILFAFYYCQWYADRLFQFKVYTVMPLFMLWVLTLFQMWPGGPSKWRLCPSLSLWRRPGFLDSRGFGQKWNVVPESLWPHSGDIQKDDTGRNRNNSGHRRDFKIKNHYYH